VLILAYPGLRVKPEWYHALLCAEVKGHYTSQVEGRQRVGWYEVKTRMIHVVYVREDHDMLRRLSHETMHYLAGVAKLGNWDKFAKLAMKEVRRGDYSRHQILSVKGMIRYGGGYELHADLPGIFEGQIPESLQKWYPWFEEDRQDETDS